MNPELQISPQEQPLRTEAVVNGEKVMTSESYNRFIHEIQKLSVKDNVDTSPLRAVFDNIHYQAAKNLAVLEHPDYPGVRELYTRISCLSVIESLGNESVKDKIAELKKKTDPLSKSMIVVSSAVPSPLSSVDGGPHTAFDIVVAQVMKSLPKVLSQIENGQFVDYEVVSLGSPLSVGGSITVEFLELIEKEGLFNVHAKFHAAYLNKTLESKKVNNIVLTGLSFGALQSIKTASHLSPDLQRKASVLADSPAPIHGKEKWSLLKGLQVFAGFAIQAAPLMFTTMSMDAKSKPSFEASYLRQMDRNGIRSNSAVGHKELRDKAFKVMASQLLRGPLYYDEGNESLLEQSEVPVYVRQSAFDSTTGSIRSTADYLKWVDEDHGIAPVRSEGKGRVFPYSGSHFINRYRDKDLRRWLKVVNNFSETESQ
jgi:pimeloyl-ACP methyl ester carboxylesterase